MLNVLEALRQVLTEAHELRPDVIWSDIGRIARRGDNAIRRFEKGETAPAFDELDLLVAGYGEALEIPVREIWERAISRAEANEVLNRSALESDERAEADQTMREIEAADTGDSAGKRGSGSQAARATKRKAG